MDFREYINNNIEKSKYILEIGPLNRPVISKLHFENIFYADIRSTEKIKELYIDNQYLRETNIKVDIDSIVDVDYVITESYTKTFENKIKFDYVILSHVIEHMPNIIYFFQDIKNIIKPNGKLIIIYPDKRYCFDHFRVESSFRDAYEIYINDNKSNPKMVFDFIFNVVPENDASYFWKGINLKEKEDDDRFLNAVKVYENTLHGQENSDIHYWPFSDYGFVKFLNDLIISKLIDFQLIEFYETPKNNQEFMAILVKRKNNKIDNKLNLKIMNDLNINSILINLNNELLKLKELNNLKDKEIIKAKELKEKEIAKILEEKDKDIIRVKELKVKKIAKILEEKDKEIKNIHNSTSWKITKPLRMFKNIICKIFRKGS